MATLSLPLPLPLLSLLLLSLLSHTLSQTPTATSPSDDCNGIFLSYTHTSGSQIPPILESNPKKQPYRFESALSILNTGLEELKSWRVHVAFENDELLVSATNAVLADGGSFPAKVGGENGTVLAGYPAADLKTAVETAGDESQMGAKVEMVGTLFGDWATRVPMPGGIGLANLGWICPKPTLPGKSEMHVCCTRDPTFKNDTVEIEENFLPRQSGDLSIMYDITRTYDSSYWARVTISNDNPLGRLDYWKLNWRWMYDEFINTMKGAYPYVIDSSDCIFGKQGQYYKELDFSTILNCQRKPTIVDLPLEKTNDTTLGNTPNCCRNGTILPRDMDPSKSTSVFEINVYKMPPVLNRSELYPPQEWKIEGTLNPNYICGPPVRVSPSRYPDSSGLPLNKTAVASWQVVCNITRVKGSSPKCCVSFSAYYNASVVPCKTCACGCSGSDRTRTCSATSPALLLPSQALLVPFENRTDLTLAWADLKHFPKPNPLPCGDNCGVSINWHLYTDYKRGWTARVTVFNWGETPFADWFVAVKLDKAGPGFEKAYSFNGTSLGGDDDKNSTIFLQGLPGLNYIVAESDGPNPKKDPRVPGKQQSVLSFTKKSIPGINIPDGDGFPTKVYFNGEECALPTMLPRSDSRRNTGISIVLVTILFLFMQLL